MKEQIMMAKDLRDFEEKLRRDERSAGTIENYLRHVRAFFAWAGGRPVSKEVTSAWKDQLLARRYCPGTVNTMLVSLNRFLAFLGWHECKVKTLRIQRRVFREETRELTRREYERLLAAAHSLGRERLALLMETICSTGIRVSEVKYITVEALRAGRAEMKAVCEKADVAPSKVFPHNLRHLFARAFYRVSRDVVKLADVLGHSSVETTRIYLISTGAEHASALNRLGLVCETI